MVPTRRVHYIHSDDLIAAADHLPSNPGRAGLIHRLISELNLLDSGTDSIDEIHTSVAQTVHCQPALREELVLFHDARYVGKLGMEAS